MDFGFLDYSNAWSSMQEAKVPEVKVEEPAVIEEPKVEEATPVVELTEEEPIVAKKTTKKKSAK